MVIIIISLILSFIFGALLMFLIFCLVAPIKEKKPKNNVHFYVARDSYGTLFLYMGKPIRATSEFLSSDYGRLINSARHFSKYELNKDDYDNLKWEDEPVEVFVNIKD